MVHAMMVHAMMVHAMMVHAMMVHAMKAVVEGITDGAICREMG
jgi:hypothetical protein